MSVSPVVIIGKVNGTVGEYEFDSTIPVHTAIPGFCFLNKKEIVEDLMKRISTSDAQQLKNMNRGSLITLHHGFGTDIRNMYGMWYEENPHTSNWDPMGDTFADQYSFAVIEELYEKLNEPKSPYAAYDAAMKGVV